MKPDYYYNSFGAELKNIEDQIRELKNRQLNGTDTVNTYVNRSAVAEVGGWDIDWTPTWVEGTESSIDRSVIFEASKQDAPISCMRYEMLVNNKDWYTVGSQDNPFMGVVSVTASVHDGFLVYAGLVPTPKKDGWYFGAAAYVSGTNIKVRFIIDSTDTGTVIVRDIA